MVIGLALFLVISFVVSNFVLSKEFDIVSALINLFTVLITLWISVQIGKRLGLKGKIPLTS